MSCIPVLARLRKLDKRKLERDFRILKLDLSERPDHPFVLFNLGMTFEDAGEYTNAEAYLRRSIKVSSSGESHLRKAWALLVNCHSQSGDIVSATNVANTALEQFPDDKELLFRPRNTVAASWSAHRSRQRLPANPV
ncbi:MAG UNVERIFIED_CONTAM: hypothetical protein LVR18_19995 [Planctomycetaceae bacterium]|jgi:uncharacterized protein HemY